MQQLIDVNYIGTYLRGARGAAALPKQQQRTPDRRLVDRRQARRSVHGRLRRDQVRAGRPRRMPARRARRLRDSRHGGLPDLDRDRVLRGDDDASPGSRRARADRARSADVVADAIARAIERPVPEVYPVSKRARARRPERARAGALRSARAAMGTQTDLMPVDCSIAGLADQLDRATRSRPPCASAAAARSIVGGWVRDRLLGRDVEGHRHRSVRRRRRPAARAARSVRPRRSGRRELPGLQDRRHRRVAAAPRVEVRPRPPRLRRHRRSGDDDRGSGAPARLHHQRDLVGSADRRVPRPVRRTRRSRRDACCGSSIRATFPDDSLRVLRARAVRGALRADARRRDARRSAGAFRSTTCRPSAIWGEIEKLLFAPRPSIGLALALELGVVEQALSRAARARRLSAGARMASRRRCLGPHAAGRRPGAHARRRPAAARSRSRSCSAPSATTSASRRRRRSSTAASDRSITKSRASRRPRAFLDRLNVHSIDGYDVRAAGARHHRAAPEARHVVQGPRRSRRRRVPAPRAESRPRTAGAARQSRTASGREPGVFNCDAMDWFLDRARRARRRASSARPDPARPTPAGARRETRAHEWERF